MTDLWLLDARVEAGRCLESARSTPSVPPSGGHVRMSRQPRRSTVALLATAALVAPLGLAPSNAGAQTRPWMDTSLSADARADLLLQEMTLQEKLELTQMPQASGIGQPVSAYYNEPIPRLGIPALRTADIGPSIRFDPAETTGFPMNIATAATWRPSLMEPLARAVRTEA